MVKGNLSSKSQDMLSFRLEPHFCGTLTQCACKAVTLRIVKWQPIYLNRLPNAPHGLKKGACTFLECSAPQHRVVHYCALWHSGTHMHLQGTLGCTAAAQCAKHAQKCKPSLSVHLGMVIMPK